MAGTIQSYKIVFDFVAKGGDQAKTQIENLIKLANQAGQTNLADSLTKRTDRINEIYDQVVNRTITAKDAVKALDKTFAGAYRDIKGTDIYGAEQSKEAKKRIDELTKSIQEYDNKINAIKTAPSSAYNAGNAKFRTKVGPGNAREAYGTSKAAEKAGLDPTKYSIEGMMGKAFSDQVQGLDFTKITNLRDLYQQLTPTLGEFNKGQLDAYNRLGAFLENVNKASDASKEHKDSLKSEKEALVEEKTQLETADAAYKQNKDAIDKLNEALKEHNLYINEEGKITQLATEKSTEHSKALDNDQKSRDRQIKATDNLIARYFTLRMAYQSIKRIMTEVYQVTKKLDDAFSEIAVVSTYTTKQVWNMYDSFLNIANITGTTSTEIIKVAGEYFKQGKSLSEALVLTEAAALSANVAGIDATESVKYLTAALNGYKLEATDALMVSDKFSKLAATSATDYADLAIALGKVAAQANASGVNMDSLLGFMTTALEVTQEAPENIGTASNGRTQMEFVAGTLKAVLPNYIWSI